MQNTIDKASLLRQVQHSPMVQKIRAGAVPVMRPALLDVSAVPATFVSQSAALLRSLVGKAPGHEERQAQLEMVRLVEYAIQERQHAIIEAATGTGKGKAYSIPAILSGQKVVISTSNKALQVQLFNKDIPWIAEHIQPVTAVIMKGESNYLCLDRLEKFGQEEQDNDVQVNDAYHRLRDLSQPDNAAFDGDFEDKALSFIPARLKSKVNRDRDLCAGSKCEFYERCYYYQMRNAAKEAQVIITNHALLTAHAAHNGKVLPPYDLAILDEAHHLEATATDAFTVRVTSGRVTSLLALKTIKNHTPEEQRDAISEQVLLTWQVLTMRYRAARSSGQRIALDVPVQEGLRLASMLEALAKTFESNKPDLSKQPKDDKLYDKLIARASHLAQELRQVFEVDNDEYVYCMEVAGEEKQQTIRVSCVPVSVTQFLKDTLFATSPVICTSATLATRKSNQAFDFFKSRVGVESAIERVLPTVFDYEHNALLYIPRDLDIYDYASFKQNPAAQERYEQGLIERMIQLVMLSRGRALLLFCSNDMKEKAYARFQTAGVPYPLLCQQEGLSREKLTDDFRVAGNAVLLGVKTFWEGIDIPGDALSLVVIDKLPFNQKDPIHEARKALLPDKFYGYDLPQVILGLKQGVGRLIRSSADRGVMAILDGRMHTNAIRKDGRPGYGSLIVQALPRARRVFDLSTVESFLNQ